MGTAVLREERVRANGPNRVSPKTPKSLPRASKKNTQKLYSTYFLYFCTESICKLFYGLSLSCYNPTILCVNYPRHPKHCVHPLSLFIVFCSPICSRLLCSMLNALCVWLPLLNKT